MIYGEELLFYGFIFSLNIKKQPLAFIEAIKPVENVCVLCVSGGVKIRVGPCEAYN